VVVLLVLEELWVLRMETEQQMSPSTAAVRTHLPQECGWC
jgi:hypothetical protein